MLNIVSYNNFEEVFEYLYQINVFPANNNYDNKETLDNEALDNEALDNEEDLDKNLSFLYGIVFWVYINTFIIL